MKAKNILFIYYHNIKAGGISKVLANLSNELIKEGHQVEILFLMHPHEDFYPIDGKVSKHYVDAFSYWTFKVCRFNQKYLRFIPKIANINTYIYQLGVTILKNRWLSKNHSRFDKIVSCWYKLSCTLAFNKKVSSKTISWEHTSHQVGGFLWNRLKRYYRNLDSIICLNRKDAEFYKSINPKTIIIGNIMDSTIENQDFIPTGEKENLITMVSRLEPEKNVLEFLQIIKKSHIPEDWRINIIGDGPQLTMLKEFADDSNLYHVSFLGQLSSAEVKDVLSRSKINCLTSLKEGFGMVLIEAMFSSNVLIAYDCPSGPAEIINEKNGFLIPLHDQQRFSDTLDYLVQNPDILESLMMSSYKESQKWKKDRILEQWNQTFQ